MLATAPDALEADFQRFYGLDTDLIWTGELPANLAAALAANLPRQAIIWQKINPRLAWDDQTYLLADIRDSLAFLAWTKPGSLTQGRALARTTPTPRHRPA
jgi:hypothetical protein